MKEAAIFVLGFLLALVTSESSSTTSWRSQPWRRQMNVQAHSGLTVVNPPQLMQFPRLWRRGGPMPGYLPLRPVSAPRNSRWFPAEATPKSSHLRPSSSYERFPPFWSENGSKYARSRRPQTQRQVRKDCNPCNSVPWTPIFKSPVGLSQHKPRELIPEVEVYPEPSSYQNTVTDPQAVNGVTSDVSPTLLAQNSNELVNLPTGNIPVSPDLLLSPKETIPFNELSPHPVAPVHHSVPFYSPTEDLIPPKSSNVIVTISEPEPPPDIQLVAQDQYSEPSSLVNSHAPNNHQIPPGRVDIVKSVPVAEYTSSIEYPYHVIQAPSYIDINTQPSSRVPNPAEYTFQKSPQTGHQKISDFILSVSKDTQSKKVIAPDSSPAGSQIVNAHSPQNVNMITVENSSIGTGKATLSEQNALDPNILTPPPLPPHLTQLLPTYDTAFLHPLLPENNQGVAGVVNGALLPPPAPQPMNPITLQPLNPTVPTKKIQIVIPYISANSQENDQNAMGSSLQSFNYTQGSHKLSTWQHLIVTEPPHNQARKVSDLQNFKHFKNFNWSEGQPSETSEVKHILASNIRDLLKKEMEPKQNIRLQKNIDNWTALEYSNHKVVSKKQPGDVISLANAVTSIPGTSISHLLLPSKKIPDGYLTTTTGHEFDEPATTPFPASSVSVNSQPFTTVSKYSSVAWTGPTARTSPDGMMHQYTTPLPESDNEILEETTAVSRWSDLKVSIAPGTNEKVYVVTPVSNWESSRRSTRHVDSTEKYTAETSQNTIFTKLEKVSKQNETVSMDNSNIMQKPLYSKSTPLFRVKANLTKYEKVSKFNKPKPIAKFFATTSKPLTSSNVVKAEAVPTVATSATVTAAFPFRNGSELPLEMAQVNFSSSQLVFKNTGERKTLIKQVKTNNRRGKEDRVVTTYATQQLNTGVEATSQQPADMQVDVFLPDGPSPVKKGDLKKATGYVKKKTADKADKADKTMINPDEPNITEDDREEINSLIKEQAQKDGEVMQAVETTQSPSMPGGVFGETRSANSSRSLLDTIKLLRDFLAETSEEQKSQEETQTIRKVIKKIDAKEQRKAVGKEGYKYNFPEYLVGELSLTKEEMGLVENAMVELQKNKNNKS